MRFLLILCVACSSTGMARAETNTATSSDVNDARRHSAQGRLLFEAKNYEAALAEFERAYELLGDHPRRFTILFNIAQSNERLFRYDRALIYYQRYLDEGSEQVEDREEVAATIKALENLLGTLEIEIEAPMAEVWIDERLVGSAPGQVRVPSGRRVVELRAPGYLPVRREVQIPARTTERIVLELEPIPADGLDPIYFYGAAVAAGLTTIGGAIFGLRALSERSTVDDRLADPAQQFLVTSEDQDRIARLSTTADVFYVGAAVFSGGAMLLYFLTDWETEDLSIGPAVGSDTVGITIRGAL